MDRALPRQLPEVGAALQQAHDLLGLFPALDHDLGRLDRAVPSGLHVVVVDFLLFERDLRVHFPGKELVHQPFGPFALQLAAQVVVAVPSPRCRFLNEDLLVDQGLQMLPSAFNARLLGPQAFDQALLEAAQLRCVNAGLSHLGQHRAMGVFPTTRQDRPQS